MVITLAIGVSSALAVASQVPADPNALTPPWATQAGLETAIAEADHLPEVSTDPAAAEGVPLSDLERVEAADLLLGVFGEVLEQPSAVYDELDVERFNSDYVAVVEGEGTVPTLLSSTLPLRAENAEGDKVPVDLSLALVDGSLQPKNPIVELEIPSDLEGGISFPETGITVKLADALDGRSPSNLEGHTAFYPNVAQDSDLVVLPTPTGMETSTVLRTSDAPRNQRYELSLPTGAELQEEHDGGARVTRGGRTLLQVRPPVAIDAQGDSVPVDLQISGNSILLEVTPGQGDAWPILVDPIFETYSWMNTSTTTGLYTDWRPSTGAEDVFKPQWLGNWNQTLHMGMNLRSYPGPIAPHTWATWYYYVPRYFSDFADPEIGARPTSYIKNISLSQVYFLIEEAPPYQLYPVLFTLLWDENKGDFVSLAGHSGADGQYMGATLPIPNPGEYTFAKSGGFALATANSVSYPRQAFVGQATVELADQESPEIGTLKNVQRWLSTAASEAIYFKVSDPGLGIYLLEAQQPTASGGTNQIVTSAECLGTAGQPCPHTLTSSDRPLAYDPGTMPQGENWITVTAVDPTMQRSGPAKARVKVDHAKPSLALSGSLTEQATVGTKLPTYVLKYNATDGDNAEAAALTPFSTQGTAEGKLERPQGIALDASDNVWVADNFNNRILKFGPTGTLLKQVGSLGSANGQFKDPRGIAVSPGGDVWVADSGNKRVQQFTANGVFVKSLTHPQIEELWGIATAPGGYVWVVDRKRRVAEKFRESDGAFMLSTPTNGNHMPAHPLGIAVDASGNVWLADHLGDKVFQFDSSGNYRFEFGASGSGNGQLNRPVGIAVTPSGNLLVVDRDNNRIQEFEVDGSYLRQFGSSGSASNQVFEPQGIVAGPGGLAYVADGGNHRVTRWEHADKNPQSGVSKVDVLIDGQHIPAAEKSQTCASTCPLSGEWTLDAGDYSVGKHKLEVIATDGVELTDNKELEFETNIVPPKISVSGTMTEQAELGAARPNYKLKVNASAGTGSGPPAPLPGLTAAYSFDAGSGAVAKDSVANHDGTIQGGAAWAEGKFGKALKFDGTDDCVSVPNSVDLQLSEAFTLQAWVNPDNASQWAPIFFKEAEGFYSYSLFFGAFSAGHLQGYVADDPYEWTEVESPGTLTANTWSHVAMTSDRTTLRLYVNGTLVDTASAKDAMESNKPLWIGCSGIWAEKFLGKIDEARIYNRALSQEEIKTDKDQAIGTTAFKEPVAAYSFDAGSGTAVADIAGADDNGTATGSPVWAILGKYGRALRFDGTDDCLSVPNSVDLQLTEAFTLEAWINPTNSSQWAPIFFKEAEGFYSYSLFFGAFNAGHVQGYVADTPWDGTEVESAGTLTANAWSHVALTSDRTSLRLYVNGEQVDTSSAEDAMESEKPLFIGCSGMWEEKFNGKIDDVRIYNRALSQEEVKADKDTAIGAGTKASTEISFDGQVVDLKQTSCLATYCPIAREWELDASAKSPGAHQVIAKVTDGSGSVRSKTLTVDVAKDSTPPTITAANAFYNAPEGWVEQKPYAVNATGKDEAGYGVTSMTLKIDGEVVRSSSQGCPAGGCNLQMALGEPIDMTAYEGGAHPAELIAKDAAGNAAKKTWTINVDPTGVVSASEAEATVSALDETAGSNLVGEAEIDPEIDGTEGDLELDAVEGGLVSVGSAAPSLVHSDPEEGISVTSLGQASLEPPCSGETAAEGEKLDDEEKSASEEEELVEEAGGDCVPRLVPETELQADPLTFKPTEVSGNATESHLVEGSGAALIPNLDASADIITRPLYDGSQVFAAIRDDAAPTEYSWEVELDPDMRLEEVDDEHAQVVYEEGPVAFTINAIAAHDAIGTTVSTSLSVSEGNVLSLHVNHRASSPAGGSFVYPVVAGAGWQGGFQTYIYTLPPGEMPEEPEEGIVEGDGLGVQVATVGPPRVEAASSSLWNVQPLTVEPKERNFKFTFCKPHKIPGNIFPPGEPSAPWNRTNSQIPRAVSECSNPELEGIFWATSVHGKFHYKVQDWVLLRNDEFDCKKWGEEKEYFAKVNCHRQPSGVVDGPIEAIGHWRFKPGKGQFGYYAGYATCWTVYGEIYPRKPPPSGQPFMRPMFTERTAVVSTQPCDWGR